MRDRNSLTRAVIEAALDCVIIMDAAGIIREFNPMAERVFGHPRRAALGRVLGELIVPAEHRAAHQAGLARILAGGESRMLGRRIEAKAMRADGSLFPVELAITDTCVRGERLFVAYLRDIGERQEAEERLRQSEQQFRVVVEDQTELILRFDADRKVSFVNRAFAAQLGRPAAKLIGTPVLEHVAEENRGWFLAQLDALTPGAPTVSYETENLLPDGGRAWEHWTDRAIFDADGRLVGYQSVGRDVTAQRAQQAEILRQREVLHQQEKLTALGSLLAGVAHELNNPLAIVIGRAQILEEDLLEPAQAAAAAKLRAAAERCARIVRTFLAMARQRPREERPVVLDSIVDAAIEMLAHGLRSAGITVIRQIAGMPVEILGDEDQLHQLVLNLIVNAQQALQDAPAPRNLWITSRFFESEIELEIADNGPGIPDAIRSRVFDPFFTTKPAGTGTGIGLSICHAIVEAHGGTIEIQERLSGGASFRIRFPRHSGKLATQPAGAFRHEAAAATAHVLVVDDEVEIAAVMAEFLRRDGYLVQVATSGREALSCIAATPFDLVVTDLRMPDGSGSELYRILLDRHRTLAKRLVVLTGDSLRTTLEELPGLDRDAILEKPVAPATLTDTVRRRLRN